MVPEAGSSLWLSHVRPSPPQLLVADVASDKLSRRRQHLLGLELAAPVGRRRQQGLAGLSRHSWEAGRVSGNSLSVSYATTMCPTGQSRSPPIIRSGTIRRTSVGLGYWASSARLTSSVFSWIK